MRLFFTLIIIFVHINFILAQYQLPNDIAFKRLTTSHGLQQDEIRNIKQDKEGFIWITTANGIDKFDGKNVTNWRIKDSSINQIMSQGIPICTQIDQDHNIWIGTDFEGIFYYNTTTQKQQRFLYDSIKYVASPYFVYTIIQPNPNTIWAATKKGIWEYNTTSHQQKISVPNYDCTNIKHFRIEGKNVFIATTENNGVLEYKNNQWQPIQGLTQLKNVNDIIYVNTTKRPNQYWIGTDDGLYIFKNNQLEKINNTDFNTLYIDKNGIIWGGGHYGLWGFDDDNAVNYTHKPFLKSSISSDNIITILQDFEGNIWVGTFTGGVNWFSLSNQPLTTVEVKNRDALQPKRQYEWKSNGIWDTQTHKIIVKTTPKAVSNDSRNIIYGQKNGDIWWSDSDKGLKKYDNRQQKIVSYSPNLKQNTALRHGVVTQIFEDPTDRLWIATFGGLHRYNDNQTFTHLQDLVKDYYSESGNSVIQYHIDPNGYIWAGRWEGGLDVIDPVTLRYRHLDKKEGLPNRCITGIVSDKNGVIWLSTLNGIVKINLNDDNDKADSIFDKAKLTLQIYSERDGLLINRINGIYYQKDSNHLAEDKLYFQTDDGINLLYPDRLKNNSYSTPTNISYINVGQNRIALSDNPLLKKQGLTLSYYQNSLEIGLAALSFIQPDRNKFKYRLEGYDADWQDNGTNHIVKYANLPPNNYIFWAQAYNNDGVAGEIYRFPIVIRPAFWQTLWFKGLLILSVVGLLFFILRNRLAAIQQREQLARQLSESELAMLRAQMNPHFIFNCMNTIEAYIMMEQPDKASAYTRKFSRLTRAVLENSEKPLIPLETDLSILKIYTELEQIRFRYRFAVEYDVSEEVLDQEPNIPPLLLQPLVENAILHGLQHRKEEGGKLVVRVAIQQKQTLICVVEDNGIGRKRSAELSIGKKSDKKSLATSITHKRLQLLEQMQHKNTHFTIEDLAEGTRATIIIPLL